MEDLETTIAQIKASIPESVSIASAQQLSEGGIKLASLLGNINQLIVEKRIAYNKVLLQCYESEKNASRAKIKAETSEEYIAKIKAEMLHQEAVEIIRMIKKTIENLNSEYKLTGQM